MKAEEMEIEKFIKKASMDGYILLRNDEEFLEMQKENKNGQILILSFHKPSRKLYKFNSEKPFKFVVKGEIRG